VAAAHVDVDKPLSLSLWLLFSRRCVGAYQRRLVSLERLPEPVVWKEAAPILSKTLKDEAAVA
jgi:hypothetical protein